jgi:hypothetical protein
MVTNVYEKVSTDYSLLEQVPQPNPRQQDKIVATFERTGYSVNQGDVAATPSERASFSQKLASGEITKAEKDTFIKGMASDIERKAMKGRGQEIIDDLEGYPNYGQIQAIMLAVTQPNLVKNQEFDNWIIKRAHMGFDQAMAITAKYGNPRDFEAAAEPFMRIMREDYPKKAEQYDKSLKVFENVVYGKRYEYSEQLKLLEKEAGL